MYSGKVVRDIVSQGLRVVVLAIACLLVLVPLVYLMLNSVKLPREFLTVPPTILPSEFTLEHYQSCVQQPRHAAHLYQQPAGGELTTVDLHCRRHPGRVSVWRGSAVHDGAQRHPVRLPVYPFLPAHHHGHPVLS